MSYAIHVITYIHKCFASAPIPNPTAAHTPTAAPTHLPTSLPPALTFKGDCMIVMMLCYHPSKLSGCLKHQLGLEFIYFTLICLTSFQTS